MDNTAAFYRYIAWAKLAERACKPTAARQHLANAARLAPTEAARIQLEQWDKRLEEMEIGELTCSQPIKSVPPDPQLTLTLATDEQVARPRTRKARAKK